MKKSELLDSVYSYKINSLINNPLEKYFSLKNTDEKYLEEIMDISTFAEGREAEAEPNRFEQRGKNTVAQDLTAEDAKLAVLKLDAFNALQTAYTAIHQRQAYKELKEKQAVEEVKRTVEEDKRKLQAGNGENTFGAENKLFLQSKETYIISIYKQEIQSKNSIYEYTDIFPKKINDSDDMFEDWRKIFPKKQGDDFIESRNQQLALQIAKMRVAGDGQLAGFKQRIKKLEQKRERKTLEAMLTATRKVSKSDFDSAKEFVETSAVVPDKDLAEYGKLVSNLSENKESLKFKMNKNGLLSELYTNQAYSYLINDSRRKQRTVFTDLADLYLHQIKDDLAGRWMHVCNELFEKDKEKAKEFAKETAPSVAVYAKNLGMDLDEFVEHFGVLGKELTKIPEIEGKYCPLGTERLRSLIRHIVKTKDAGRLEKLLGNSLSSHEISRISKILPVDLNNEDLLEIIEKTDQICTKLKTNSVGDLLAISRLAELKQAQSKEECVADLNDVDKLMSEYIAFVKEQRTATNIGFDDRATQSTINLYRQRLGKNFEQFKRDYNATGNELTKLVDIAMFYHQFLGDEKLKSMLNYVSKERSKDLIRDLYKDPAPEKIFLELISKFDVEATGKRTLTKIFQELNKTYAFLENLPDFDGQKTLLEKVRKIKEASTPEQVLAEIAGIRKKYYSDVIGDAEVPKQLEESIDNIVYGYYTNSGKNVGINMQEPLRFIASTYARKGPTETFNAIRTTEENLKLRKKLQKKGTRICAYERGIRRTYNLRTADNEAERMKEKIESEFNTIYDRMREVIGEVDEEAMAQLKTLDLKDQLMLIENFAESYEFNKENERFKQEIEGHIETIKRLNTKTKEISDTVEFYVCQDPLEALHMGQYFGSCLSLAKNHGGINGWASVVQTMDSNKNVIYAKGSGAKPIARNRTALTDKGVLCTRFYQTGNLFMDHAWISYLTDFSDKLRQEIMIPSFFATHAMQTKLAEMMKTAPERVVMEERTVHIQPAHFSSFYGDGLSTQVLKDGRIQVTTNAYVIRPNIREAKTGNTNRTRSKPNLIQRAYDSVRSYF